MGGGSLRLLVIWAVLLTPLSAVAWESLDRNQAHGRGTIGEITAHNNLPAISMGGLDLVAGCRLAAGIPADGELNTNEYLVGGGTYAHVLESLLPLVLFFKAHNTPVQIMLQVINRQCVITRIRTCFDPQTCNGAPPPIRRP